jgi:hypothetical protein
MGGKDSSFEVVYRGGIYHHYLPGKWVFFQREKHYGGGFWIGQAYDDGYLFGIPWPVSLREGIKFLSTLDRPPPGNFIGGDVDDFELT